jgi:hypothetical protein
MSRSKGMKKNNSSILTRKFNKPDLRADCTCTCWSTDRSSFISGSAGGTASSAGLAPPCVPDKSLADTAAAVDDGLDTMIIWVHTRHLKRAAAPLILEGSIRYFFPHSSQMTIMVALLK